MQKNQTIHSSINYEYHVLGLMLQYADILPETLNYLKEDDFYDQENKMLFSVIKVMYEQVYKNKLKDISIEEIFTYLKTHQKDSSISGNDYLVKVISNAGSKENLMLYMQELTRLSSIRKLENVFIKTLSLINTTTDLTFQDYINKFDKDILELNIKHESTELKRASEVSSALLMDLQKRRSSDSSELAGVTSGFYNLDKLTNGFKEGELIIIAARPAMGKTAFALNIAANAALSGKKVAFFSMEMSDTQLMARIFSSECEIPADKIKKPQFITKEEWNRLLIGKSTKIDTMDLFIDDSTSSKLNELQWKARRLKQISGLDILIVDYLQLLVTGEKNVESRQNEVAKISRSLKQLARELEIPVIALSQLSRGVEQREDKRPIMSDLKDSGGIEQDADMVMFLYREGYYKRKKEANNSNNDNNFPSAYESGEVTELIIGKHRNGPTGILKLRFIMNISKFQDVRLDPEF
ncbi:replicative DNA helicase [Mycoplasmopsis ciconiae]|uniref:Replicative DNA helicase n=1 Tax=Mycoplasmopsis ciconiae TaxID=561067 RepID=A0ABU7ML76_9BACT|nr:replicative DNA helicase [Mycoplasmopsis ciconiae]